MEYQFTNSNNWSIFWHETLQAEDVPNAATRFYPIPKKIIGITLESPIIAIYAHSQSAQGNWKYAGRIFAKIATGLTVSAGTPDTVVKVSKFWLNQIEIIRFPNFSSAYSLEIEIPYWIRDESITIWEYIGDDTNTIHDKLDQLLINTA
jgi:hypothetical protein